MRLKHSLTILGLCLVMATSLRSESGSEQQVEDFSLHSHRGHVYSLSDFKESKLVVVAFLGTECPLAKLYGPRLNELQDEYRDRGVTFFAIDANVQDSLSEMTEYAEEHQVTIPWLKDPGNRVADAFKAQRTPEVFLLDEGRKVRYRGRIDDQYLVGVAREKPQRRHLAEAIDELLAGKDVSISETEAVGCHIGRVTAAPPSGEITYASHIAKIFNSRCASCHREGEIAPFSLTSYDDVLGWEETILEVVSENRMPPWFANPEHGQFANDARLPDEEKDLLRTWIENGMPSGDLAHAPALPPFEKGWQIERPDQVIYMREQPFDVPAEGVVDYQRWTVDPGWTEDRYIRAAEARPGNGAVVHHILVFVLEPGKRNRGINLGSVLVGYAPGAVPVDLKDGVAIHVPAGSRLLFEMHYTPNGSPSQQDRSYIGVKFIPQEEVKQIIRGRVAINESFRIPANAPAHEVTADYQALRDEMLVSMTPHMHLRGKAFRYEAIYPDQRHEVLLDVPKYDFNWQLRYILREPKLIPKGTTIQCTAIYDNSPANPANPDPRRVVRWGDQSWEEMMIGFFDVIPVESTHVEDGPNVESDLSVSGTWTWERGIRGEKRHHELRLTQDQNRLTGELSSGDRKLKLSDLKLQGDRLTFQAAVPDFPNIRLSFDARITGNALQGTATLGIEALGRAQSLPWTATREERE